MMSFVHLRNVEEKYCPLEDSHPNVTLTVQFLVTMASGRRISDVLFRSRSSGVDGGWRMLDVELSEGWVSQVTTSVSCRIWACANCFVFMVGHSDNGQELYWFSFRFGTSDFSSCWQLTLDVLYYHTFFSFKCPSKSLVLQTFSFKIIMQDIREKLTFYIVKMFYIFT